MHYLHALDQKFAILDELPESLYALVITHSHGELHQRAAGILQWRDALLAGELPSEQRLIWPDKEICRTILMRLEVLDIVQYCRQQEELTDSVLESILEGVSSAEDFSRKTAGVDSFDDKQAQRQNVRDRDSAFEDKDGLSDHLDSSSGETDEADTDKSNGETTPHPTTSPQAQPQIHLNAERGQPAGETHTEELQTTPADANIQTLDTEPSQQLIRIAEYSAEHIEKQWQELADSWHELAEIFDELSGFLGRGWDLTRGLLACGGWRDIIRYRKLIKQIPYLQQLVAMLGRLREISSSDNEQSITEQIFVTVKRITDSKEEQMTPHAVNETGGITRSDDIARMLPTEMALLGHPRLKMLWHAKRAERTLMTYQLQGVLSEHTPQEHDILEQQEQTKSTKGQGPIILCLDTSGSMQGEPEQIAKALVIEALRIAFEEQRPCYLYSFSGPEQILEHELDLTTGGLGRLLQFLQQSFHGGTDVTQPLIQALRKQQQQGWEQADILLISDGRFPPQPQLAERIKKAKATQELRLHGVLLGNWQGKALSELCDPVHRFSEWGFA
ncbi:MAG: VWA domain-containing protein [Pseudomonadota bacterium]|nr:VWA domain-containing protein [Pseudomonadota bacterium]